MRIAYLSFGGILLAVATLAHWFYVGGWCGYYDGGPKPDQEWACDGGVVLLWPSAFALISIGGLYWSKRARSDDACLLRLIVVLVLAVIFGQAVPFDLAEGTG